MQDDELHELVRKLKPIIGAKADQLWIAYLAADDLRDRLQIASLIQLTASKHLSPTVDDQSILLPPPPSGVGAAGEFLLGTALYRNRPVGEIKLSRTDLQQHTSILARTGGGKTNVTQLLILGLLRENVPFVVVDFKRSYRDLYSIRAQAPEVVKIEVFTVGRSTSAALQWNPLRPPPGIPIETWIKKVSEALERSHIGGAGSSTIFIRLFHKLFDRMGFFEGAPSMYPNFHDALTLAQDEVRPVARELLWYQSCVRILSGCTYGPATGAFNARHPVHLEDLLDRFIIFELDREMPDDLRTFFSEILMRWIHLYRLQQGESETLRHVLCIEEIHNLFLDSKHKDSFAADPVETLFRELRGFGEGIIGITQNPSRIPTYILGNVNNQIYLGLQGEVDIIAAKRALFLNPGEERYLDQLQVGEGIVKIKGRIAPCHVRFPKVPVRKGTITDAMLNTFHTSKKDTEGENGTARLD